MLSVQSAQAKILNLVKPLDSHQDTETVNLETALGRILAQPVVSKLDFPHWDNSAMDGYAVRFEDVQNCHQNKPAVLEIVEEIPAGYQPQTQIQANQAARIFTGGVMPEGADTVVMQENTQRENSQVLVLESPPEKGNFVRHRAAFYQAGTTLLQPGITIGAPEIAILAAAQCTQLTVYRRPRVAILSTGDELVTPQQELQPGQIVDSNQYALAAVVSQAGGIALPMGIVPDQPDALKQAIAQATTQADFVLSTGGVSVGDYDYVDQILKELGGELHIQSVAVKPGKPLTVATFPNCMYFGIPGNPVSALVSCWRFVQPALKKFSGLAKDWEPKFVRGKTKHVLKASGKRETYLWGNLQWVEGNYQFSLAGGSHSSGNLINLAQTNGLAIVPVGTKVVEVGEEVEIMIV